jgi:hypothetical protein
MGGKMLDTFYLDVISLTDMEELHRMKEELKDQVVDPSLNWKGRMEIYRKVQLIMERIQCLQEDNHQS